MQDDVFTKLYGENAFEDSRNYDAAGNFKPRPIRDSDAESQTRRGYRRGFQALETLLPTRDSQDAFVEAQRAYDEKRERLESARRTVSDGTPADAQQAYEEKRAHLRDAWKSKQKATSDNAAPPTAQDAAQACALADSAWQEKKQRLQDGWKQR
jgi:hypothetical protein